MTYGGIQSDALNVLLGTQLHLRTHIRAHIRTHIRAHISSKTLAPGKQASHVHNSLVPIVLRLFIVAKDCIPKGYTSGCCSGPIWKLCGGVALFHSSRGSPWTTQDELSASSVKSGMRIVKSFQMGFAGHHFLQHLHKRTRYLLEHVNVRCLLREKIEQPPPALARPLTTRERRSNPSTHFEWPTSGSCQNGRQLDDSLPQK